MQKDETALIVILAVSAGLIGVDQLIQRRARNLNSEERCGICGTAIIPYLAQRVPIALSPKSSYRGEVCDRCAQVLRALDYGLYVLLFAAFAVTGLLLWLSG